MTLPPAYTLLAAPPIRAALRSDLVPVLGGWLTEPTLALPADAQALASGRGPVFRVVLPGGLRAVVRRYRRGGLLARIVRETYAGFSPRPLRELTVTTEARRRGVAAAEVLGARVEGRWLYRGVLVTAEVPDTITLIEALRRRPAPPVRRALAASAGEAVARLHDAGVVHADLNLHNVLVDGRGEQVTAIVDFDRARLCDGPLGRTGRRRSLRRLHRSLRKLDPDGALYTADDLAAFHVAYGRPREVACVS